MADFSFSSTPFAVGSSAQAHRDTGLDRAGAPSTTAVASATVGAAGQVAFTGLADDTGYLLAGQGPDGGWVWRRFRTDPPVAAADAATVVTKRATIPLAGDGNSPSSYGAGVFDGCQRTLLVLPVTPTRWRLRISNRKATTDANGTGTIDLTGVWLGDPDWAVQDAQGRGGWTYVAAPAQAIGSGGQIVGGTELVTAWVTTPALMPRASVPKGISLGLFSSGAVDTFLSTRGRLAFGSGASAAAGGAALPLTSANQYNLGFFDVRFEYEYQTALGRAGSKLIVALGDSLVAGVASAANYAYPHESWSARAALRHGHTLVNMGIIGSAASDWTAGTGWRWDRFDLTGLGVPDEAIVGLGSNDVALGHDLATIQADLLSVLARVRARGIERTGLATIIPRYGFTATQEAVKNTVNAWLRNKPLGASFLVDQDKAIRAEVTPDRPELSMLPVVDGAHPSLAGHERIATAY